MKSSERKHLRMQIFLKNKNSRSKDQNKISFDFTSPAMKTKVNRILLETFRPNLVFLSVTRPSLQISNLRFLVNLL